MSSTKSKKYILNSENKITPDSIRLNDEMLEDNVLLYLNDGNLERKLGRMYVYKSIINARLEVRQFDLYRLKISVFLENKIQDWYIPSFEKKSMFSEKKIYIIGNDEKLIATFPIWWSVANQNAGSPKVYIPKNESINMFSYFTKGDTYQLEYILDIPKINNEKFSFKIYYHDNSKPSEISTKYSRLNNANLFFINVKSNEVNVSCFVINNDVENGFNCIFD